MRNTETSAAMYSGPRSPKHATREMTVDEHAAYIREHYPSGSTFMSLAREAYMRQHGLHYTPQGLIERDSPRATVLDGALADELSSRLAGYCGEGGRHEGAVETLDRLLAELHQYRTAHVQQARVAKSEAQVLQRKMQDGPHGAMLGSATHGRVEGMAQMLRAPGKMFSRETICAILRSRVALVHPANNSAILELEHLLTIFQNLE